MQAPEFYQRVQDYGQIRGEGEAARVTRAVLLTLAERIGYDEIYDLFAQLPSEIAQPLTAVNAHQREDIAIDEFVSRICTRAGVDEPTARRYTRAVLSAVQEATTSGTLADIMARLPHDFDPLFAAERANLGR